MSTIEEENKTLKDNVEFLHSCLDDRDKSIAIMQEENKRLSEKNKIYSNALVQEKEEKKKLKENIKWYEKEEDRLREENRKLKLHIEAKDKAYVSLLKDYEEIKEDRKKILDEIEAEIERFKAFRNK